MNFSLGASYGQLQNPYIELDNRYTEYNERVIV